MRPCAVVCDDDPVLRRVVSAMLERHGWVASEAATARDAVELVRALQPGLCIVDIALVGMSGLEALPQLREASPLTRVVVLAAFDGILTKARGAGAAAAFAKAELADLDAFLGALGVAASA